MSDATLVYDDDCGFCTWSARRVAERSDVELVAFSELTDDLREQLPDDYEDCAHLLVDGEVYSCGAAMEEAAVRTGEGETVRPLANFLRQFDDYIDFRERVYREIADRRDLFGQFLYEDPPARDAGGE